MDRVVAALEKARFFDSSDTQLVQGMLVHFEWIVQRSLTQAFENSQAICSPTLILAVPLALAPALTHTHTHTLTLTRTLTLTLTLTPLTPTLTRRRSVAQPQ